MTYSKKTILPSLLLAFSMATAAQTSICLNGEWQFHYAENAKVADSLKATGFERTDYDASNFRPTPVPSCWAVLGYEEPVYRNFKNAEASEGFYRHTFRVPKDFRGKRMLLHFGGVWASAEVWLNGTLLGRHDSGFTPCSFVASDYIKAGEENVLAVRVRQVYPEYESDTYDDWALGGIYRDVTLEAMPNKRWLERIRVETKMNGEVSVKVLVADTYKNTLPGNYMSPGKPYQLRVTLIKHDGQVVANSLLDVSAHTSNSRETNVKMIVDNPELWTAETPYLYSLKTELIEKDGVSHTRTQRIGIREISTEGGVFRINGQAVKLRGINRHDEHPDVGRAVTREHWLEDLRLMKQANINFVRACHYQHAKGFIELCDSMGFYVGAEISLGGASGLMREPNFTAPVMLRVVETVERDLSNPSVIYWSIGNEDAFSELFHQAARVVKGLDPSRPTLLPWNADDTLPEEIDILAPHYWIADEYAELASKATRPIITTEYVHAYGEQRFGGLADSWEVFKKYPAAAGGAVWMWADQGLKTPTKKDRSKYGSLGKDDDYLRLDAQGWDGITDSYRRPTRDFYEVKAVYCPIYPDVENVKLSKKIRIPIRNGYDFTELNTVSIAWELFIDGEKKDAGQATLDAAPHQTAMLTIPTGKLGKVKQGETAYVWLTFTDKQGEELGKADVEIITDKQEKVTMLPVTLRHDASTGLPEGFRPTVWHRLNDGDYIIKNRNFASNPEKFVGKVISSEKKMQGEDEVIKTSVMYEINDSNSIEAVYTCTYSPSKVTVDYELTPRLQSNYVPIVGLAYKVQNTETLHHWFGLGPDDAYPNKKAATLLGLWGYKGVSGTRAMRWVEVDGMRILCDGYLDRDAADSQEIRLLSRVLGRSEKGRLNYLEHRLPNDKAYKGSITILHAE